MNSVELGKKTSCGSPNNPYKDLTEKLSGLHASEENLNSGRLPEQEGDVV